MMLNCILEGDHYDLRHPIMWLHWETKHIAKAIGPGVVVLYLVVDTYYRAEWFYLHSDLAFLLEPFFGGHAPILEHQIVDDHGTENTEGGEH